MSKTFGVVGSTIRLNSGCYLDLLDPRPDQFTMSDIACGLSKICRFGGQIEQFYSVAEHCLVSTEIARERTGSVDFQKAVLMHDAAEAFVGDIVKPLKVLLPEFSSIENRLEACIFKKYSIDFGKFKERAKAIDMDMLIAERNHFFSKDEVAWVGEDEVEKINPRFWGYGPGEAKKHYLWKMYTLGVTDD